MATRKTVQRRHREIESVRSSSLESLRLLAIPLFLVATAVLAPFSFPFLIALGVYGLASVACFGFYLADKRAARRGTWRITENTLHLLSLAGGWPGALLAQRVLRHKTSKASFQTVFWITVVLNVAAFFFVMFSIS